MLTSLLIALTSMLTHFAPFIAIGFAVVAIVMYRWYKTENGRTTMDGLKLRVPVVKTLIVQYVLAQITRTLATVLRGGIPLVQSLDTTAGVINNRVMGRKLTEARSLVIEGVSLADAFDRTKLAPDMTVRMIAVGEQSGELPQMLEDVAEFYDQEVENRLTVLTTMIEPVLMVTMGIVMAVIVVALYLPIFEMGAHIK